MMKTTQKTLQLSWFCPGCGTKVIGTARDKGMYVGECSNCHAVMARSKIARHHMAVEMLPPQHAPITDGKWVLNKIRNWYVTVVDEMKQAL